MSNIEKAKRLFQKAGLAFPAIPDKLAKVLKEQENWLFASRKIEKWPYFLPFYLKELDKTHVNDYVILSHSGHGVNSYALQYYLVYGDLELFLHLGWGGVYMDAESDAAKIRDCFSIADEIVSLVETGANLGPGRRLRIVVSDSYGSYWSVGRRKRQNEEWVLRVPEEVLTEVLHWLKE